MYSFKQFLREGLTYWQNELAQKAAAKRSARVLKQTDHYFGKGVDEKKATIADPGSKKSPVHQEVEKHLGREISHSDYHEGLLAADSKKPQNRTKIGKLIKDSGIRDRFNADPARTRDGSNYKYSPVIQHSDEHHELVVQRGAHVAGMSNSESAPEHPTGHPWAHPSIKSLSRNGAEGSCMTHPSHSDIHDLEDEEEKTTLGILHSHVQHGGVVLYGRKNGIDKYREFRIPYKNTQGHVIFHKNNSYGEHHPAFMDAAEAESSKMSGKPHGSILYKADRSKFYVEGPETKLRPGTTDKHLENALNPNHSSFEHDIENRKILAQHHASTDKHFEHLAKDDSWEVRQASLVNSKTPTSHMEKLTNDPIPGVHKTAKFYLAGMHKGPKK